MLLLLLACNDYSLNSEDKLLPGIDPNTGADLNPGGGSPDGQQAEAAGDSGSQTDTSPPLDTAEDPCIQSEHLFSEKPGAALMALESHPVVADYPGGGAENTEFWLDAPREIRIAGSEEAGNASLGTYVPGDELVFRIDYLDTGTSHYTGPGSRNPDGEVHASITYAGGCLWQVDFHATAGDSGSLSGRLLVTGPLELSDG